MKNKKLLCLLVAPLMLVGCTKESAPQYTISFDANGGTGTMAEVVMEAGEYVLPECTFTAPENKEFSNWLIGDEAKNVGETYNVSSDLLIKADWKVSTLATVYGAAEADLSAYGMGKFTVSLELELLKDHTANYTISYNDYPFTFNDVVWEDCISTGGYISVALPEIDAETNQAKADRVVTPIYVNDSSYYGFISTNLDGLVGKVLVSNNKNVSVLANLEGEVDFYGMYHEDVSLILLSDYNALYSVDLGEMGAFAIPTTWAMNSETGGVEFTYLFTNGETSEMKTGSILMGVNAETGEVFATSSVETSLGVVALSTHSFVASLTGGVEFYGYTCNVTLDIYAGGWAVETLDYGENAKFSIITTYSAMEGSENLSFNYVSVSAEGEISIVPVVITVVDGVYTATVPTNLGDANLTSEVAA